MDAVHEIIPVFWALFWFSASLSQLQVAIPFPGAACSPLSAFWLGLLFLHLCNAVHTKAGLSRLMPVSPQSWEPRHNPASPTKPWHVPCPTLIMELRPWAYSWCQAQFQFHAWPSINYAWSDVLGLTCSPLICHSLLLPHLARATISVQLGGKPYTGISGLSGSMKMTKILQQPFSRVFFALHILFWENAF